MSKDNSSEALEIEDIPAPKGRISFSQYYMWSKCPQHWKLTYVDKHKIDSPSIHTLFGTAMHETIQHYLTVMYGESIKTADAIDLNAYLMATLRTVYEKDKSRSGNDFTDLKTLAEFYGDGVEILTALKRDRNSYFPKKGWELAGIEFEIDAVIESNVRIVGFIDIVLKDTDTGKIKIIDLKTSTRGWNDYAKKDKEKVAQIIIYKWFYGEATNIDMSKIDVEYLVLKRKLLAKSEFPQKRMQRFVPANGSVTVKRTIESLKEFIRNGFNEDGTHKTGDQQARPSASNCKFCEFKNRKDLCPVGYGSVKAS